MRTYQVIIHEYFEDDSTRETIFKEKVLEQVLELFETLDGKSFPVLEIFLSQTSYPSLYVIGGPDLFTFSLAKSENTWQEINKNPNPDASKWRAFGLGYHNYEFFDCDLLNKQVTIKAIHHFCITGEWLASIPSHIKQSGRLNK